jgi:uncharacterized membrane protein
MPDYRPLLPWFGVVLIGLFLEAQVERAGADAFYAASGYEPEPDVRVFSRSLIIRDRGDEKPEA